MLGRRNGRPSLIGTAARTAVIAGTATAVSGAVASKQHHKQQQKAVAQQAAAQQAAAQQQASIQAAAQQAVAEQAALQQQAAPAAGGLTEAKIAQLQQLGELHKSGVLSDAEFAEMKAKVLAG